MIKSIHSKLYLKATSLKHLCFLLFLSLFLASPAWATNWYVSQTGAGAKNGTSISNAWAKTGVVWGSMSAGDTLYVVGVLHGSGFGGLSPTTSGATNNYFTIAGQDATSGVIVGPEFESAAWTAGSYGSYYVSTTSNTSGAGEWLTASGPLAFQKLTQASGPPDGTWTEGMWYWTGTVLHWKPFGGTIANKTVTSTSNSANFLDNVSWVKVTNLTTIGTPWEIGYSAVSNHIWLDHLTIKYIGTGVIINQRMLVGGCNYIRVSYSTISHGSNGIYMYTGYNSGESPPYTNFNSDYITIDHNTITDMSGDTDSHCVGLMGGSNHVIEYNDLSYCNTGITIYSNNHQTTNNNTIRYNKVHHMDYSRVAPNSYTGYGRGYGIGFEGPVGDPTLRTGNQIYYNLAYSNTGYSANLGTSNTAAGIQAKFSAATNYVYNNTVYDCSPSFYIDTSSGTTDDVFGVFKNNISLSPNASWGQYHVYLEYTSGSYGGLNMDYNLYFPTGNQWIKEGLAGKNFSDWKTWLSGNKVSGDDTNSLTGNPLITNGSRSYSQASDFTLQASSPAINKGDNTVWSGKSSIFDFSSTGITSSSGIIMAPGGVVDIGAYEKEEISISPPKNIRVVP